MKIARVALTLLLSLGPAAPQDAPTFSTNVNVVVIDVRVSGRDGKPLTDLKKEDFLLFEDVTSSSMIG